FLRRFDFALLAAARCRRRRPSARPRHRSRLVAQCFQQRLVFAAVVAAAADDDADRDRDRQQGEEADRRRPAVRATFRRWGRRWAVGALAHRREVARGGIGAVAAAGGAVDAVALLRIERRAALLAGLVLTARQGGLARGIHFLLPLSCDLPCLCARASR